MADPDRASARGARDRARLRTLTVLHPAGRACRSARHACLTLRRDEGMRPRTDGPRGRRSPRGPARTGARTPARRCAARRARRPRATRSNRSSHGSRQSRTSAVSARSFRAALRRNSSIASVDQSVAVTSAPFAAATSEGNPSPQPSSTTRSPAHLRQRRRRALALRARAPPNTAGTRRLRTPLRRSAPRATPAGAGRAERRRP